MKLAIFLILTTSLSTYASQIDRSVQSRIQNACIASVEIGGRKVPRYKTVCRCIAETHFKSALQESKRTEAMAHINWTVEFYETIETKRLQELIKQNPKFSSFDDQVVDDCISSPSIRK